MSSNKNGCSSNIAPENVDQDTILQRIFNKSHILQTILYIIQIILSYLLMLIVMTFNYWLFVAVILGSGIGYFLFGWLRERLINYNEHCH